MLGSPMSRRLMSTAMGAVPAAWRRGFEPGLSMLTSGQVEQYYERGWVIVDDVFDPSELKPVQDAIDGLVDELAEDVFRAGLIENKHEDKTFADRITHLEKEFPHIGVLMHKRGILPQEFVNVWCSPQLDGIARQLVGPDVGAMPVWNLRVKPPSAADAAGESTVPWHQDAAYLDQSGWETHQLTCWLPLVNAVKETGCLQVLDGGHRSGNVAKHTCCVGGTWYVELPEEEFGTLGVSTDDLVTCEVPLGSVLLLNNLIPHQSLPNLSNIIRWSLDLRWQNPDESNGFYGLKETLPLHRSNDPGYEADWSTWGAINRSDLQEEKYMEMVGDGTAPFHGETADHEKFDTTISGPWMGNWDIVHHNRHTKTFDGDLHGWHKA